MDTDEPCLADQVGGLNRLGSETQVGSRLGTGLLRVVDEVALGVGVGVRSEDLDGVLVSTDGAVRTHAVEHCADRCGILDVEGFPWQGYAGDVVVDTDGETGTRTLQLELGDDPGHHTGGEFL